MSVLTFSISIFSVSKSLGTLDTEGIKNNVTNLSLVGSKAIDIRLVCAALSLATSRAKSSWQTVRF